jgi:hypothetical protein
MAWLEGRGSWEPVEPVVPFCEQFRAQHKSAIETSGVRFSVWAAFLQQSIPAISGILHSCSLEWSGMPAKTLPPITRINTNDATRVTMPSSIYESVRPLSSNRIASFLREAIGLASDSSLTTAHSNVISKEPILNPERPRYFHVRLP